MTDSDIKAEFASYEASYDAEIEKLEQVIDDQTWQIRRLRDEIADRSNVEADLRAQLAETQQRIERAGPSLRLSTTRAVMDELAHREGINSHLARELNLALVVDGPA